MEKKLESLQNPVDKKYNDEDYMKKCTEFDTKIDNLQKIVCQETEKKFEMFESKIINLTKALADKDENINTLVKRLKDMEKCLLQVQKKKENLEVEIQSLEIETEVMKCDKCDFRTNSKRGFKTQMRRKHTVQDLISLSCELCDFETKIKI